MPNFFREDLVYIEKEVSRVLREEIKTRLVLPFDSNYDPNAREVGYDIYDINGSAKVLALGGSAKDIPFVGDSLGRDTQPVYNIVTGIRFEKAEREAIQARRTMGKGATINLDSERIAAARRFIFEQEMKLVFTGNAQYGIKGIFDNSFYGAGLGTKQLVVDPGAGREWVNKTPAQILADIRTGVEVASANGLFPGPKVITLPYTQWFKLTEPFNDGTEKTILDWLVKSLPGQVTFEYFNIHLAANNGDAGGFDTFMVHTRDPRLVKVALPKDISVGAPVFDLIETSEQAVMEKTAGVVVKHPSSLYIGRQI